jgi:hypothetical protein
VVGAHTYADEGQNSTTVTINDKGGSALVLTGSAALSESDVLTPSGLTISAIQGQAFGGAVATFTDLNSGNVAADFTASINWGDGTATAGTIAGTGGTFTVSGGHTYASGGKDSVTATLTDNPPGTASVIAAGTAVVTPLAPAVAIVTPGPSINFGNVHAGGTLSQALTIGNAATAPAAALDGTVTALTGNATGSGTFAGLAPGVSNSGSISVGVDTSGAGVRSGSAVLGFTSDSGTLGTAALPSQTIAVAGTAYREAAAALLPLTEIVHVGDPGTANLAVTNTDPADGYSERLIALVSSTTGGFSIAAGGPTPDIAAGTTNTSTLALAFSTLNAGTISGGATVGLTSDGGTGAGSIDGLGETALPSQTAAVNITVDNYADPVITSGGSLTVSGTNYILNLGTAVLGAAPLTAALSVGNAATGPADWLNGTFAVSGAAAFSNSGFAGFGTLAAGSSLGAGSVSLATGQTGVFSETIALTPGDGNTDGYSGALATRTVTVTGTIDPTGSAAGDVHMVTFDGLHYDFQAVGDYVLTRATAPGDPFQIQIETAADATIKAVSITTQVAARIGSDTVTFVLGRDREVWVDGAPDAVLTVGQPQQLTGGQLLETSPGNYRIDWAGGETLNVTDAGSLFNTAVSLGLQDGPGSVQGLLGGDSGQQNDLQLADGTVLPIPQDDNVLLGAFASAWRVTPSTSLLNPAPMQFIYTDAATGQSVLQATAPGQVLSATPDLGVLSDADGLGVTFSGTLADLTREVMSGFNSRDILDITDLNAAAATGGYSGSATIGVLHLGDGVHAGDINLAGQVSGVPRIVSDSHGGSLVTFA